MKENLTLSSFKYFAWSALFGAILLAGGYTIYKLANPTVMKGVPDTYGQDPKPPSNIAAFKPKFFTVIYLKFRDQGESGSLFIAKHAYFKTAGDLDKLECAITYLRTDGSSINDCGLFKKNGIRYNFDQLDFGAPQRIYAFIDNQDVQFRENIPISFTPFGPFDDPYSGGPRTRNENKSFDNAKVQKLGDSQSVGLYVENHFKDIDGNPMKLGSRKTKYSINFNVVVCRKTGVTCNFHNPKEVIPIAIDPDTGNGWGNEPHD